MNNKIIFSPIGLALHDLGCEVGVLAPTQAGPVPGLTIHPIVERWDWRCWLQGFYISY